MSIHRAARADGISCHLPTTSLTSPPEKQTLYTTTIFLSFLFPVCASTAATQCWLRCRAAGIYILAAHSHRTLRPRSPHTSVAKARNLPTGPEGARAGRCEERAAAENGRRNGRRSRARPEGQEARAQGGRGKETRTQQTGTEAGAPLASWAALDSLLNLDTRGCP